MKTLAVLLFGAGVLLAVRVMFFGVRRTVGHDEFRTRAWPLAISAVVGTAGAVLYLLTWRGQAITALGSSLAVLVALTAGLGAWWTVRRSADAAAKSPDPDEDPRFRYQGHVARVVTALQGAGPGHIAFVIDGRTMELAARWLPGTTMSPQDGAVDSEVVIEHVDGDVAYVEPWALVEGRL